MNQSTPPGDSPVDFPGFFIPDSDQEWAQLDACQIPMTPVTDTEITETVKITLRHPNFERASSTMNYQLKDPPSDSHQGQRQYTKLSPALKCLVVVLLASNATSLALSLKNSESDSTFSIPAPSHNHNIDRQNQTIDSLQAEISTLKAALKKRQTKIQRQWPNPASKGSVTAKMPNISVEFEDLELRKALQLISEKIDKNLIISPAITGKISANLKNIQWRDAIENLIKSVGPYSLVEETTGVLRIDLTSAAEDRLITTVIKFGYIKGTDSSFPAMRALTQLVESTRSNKDFVQYQKETNSVVIRASYITTQEILKTIKALDQPQQVKVQPKSTPKPAKKH